MVHGSYARDSELSVHFVNYKFYSRNFCYYYYTQLVLVNLSQIQNSLVAIDYESRLHIHTLIHQQGVNHCWKWFFRDTKRTELGMYGVIFPAQEYSSRGLWKMFWKFTNPFKSFSCDFSLSFEIKKIKTK